jgi:hypothetical protein
MINPYFCYALGFAFSLAIYNLNWSEAYPQLSLTLSVFLLITIGVHILLGIRWVKEPKEKTLPTPVNAPFKPIAVTTILLLLWAFNFIHEGGIPLVNIILKIPFDYKIFGTPALHVFVVTFSSFYGVYLLEHYLTSRKKSLLWLYLVNFIPAFLLFSRAMILFNLSTALFLYLLHLKQIHYRYFLWLIPTGIIVFYVFGVIGTIRVSFESKQNYDQNLFLETGSATTSFRNSNIPKEFLWPYIYVSSPVANLQTNINSYPVKPITIGRVLEFINNEWFVESLSKRLNQLAGVQREPEHTIRQQFNVSTVYSRSYSYLGWWGILATGTMLLLFPLFYLKMIPYDYRTLATAMLCTIYLFLCYDNTIRLMALGFQLFFPVLFPFVERKFKTLPLHA